MSYYVPAFLLGLASSLHCVGMCGPIALALPNRSSTLFGLVWSRIQYNFGRIITYGLLGLLFGIFGKGLALAGVQQFLSIGLGLLLLIVAVTGYSLENKLVKIPAINKLNIWVKSHFNILFKADNQAAMLLFGLLNGLLPCGMVYIAIIGAIASGNAIDGMSFMVLFGLGTFPLMMATSMAGSWFGVKTRQYIKKTVPIIISAFAILLILRGLNLDIPYISPKLNSDITQIHKCH